MWTGYVEVMERADRGVRPSDERNEGHAASGKHCQGGESQQAPDHAVFLSTMTEPTE